MVVRDQRIGKTPRAVRAGCQGGRMAKGQEMDKAWPLLEMLLGTYRLLGLGLGHHVVHLRHLHRFGRHFD